MLKKSASGVLTALRGAHRTEAYASPLRALRPCWTAFLSTLRVCALLVKNVSVIVILAGPKWFFRILLEIVFVYDRRWLLRKMPALLQQLLNLLAMRSYPRLTLSLAYVRLSTVTLALNAITRHTPEYASRFPARSYVWRLADQTRPGVRSKDPTKSANTCPIEEPYRP